MENTIIFVFGSNREGRHGKGAALTAKQIYGARYGQAQGRQGNSYAIITKELRRGYPKVEISEIKANVDIFIEYANAHPELSFLVTAIGCGLGGFKPAQIAPLFKGSPKNVVFPNSFTPYV